jgi:hypothetical protein
MQKGCHRSRPAVALGHVHHTFGAAAEQAGAMMLGIDRQRLARVLGVSTATDPDFYGDPPVR